jgi:hypothetical protein
MSIHDIERVLARYKEHVVYWNIRPEVVERELIELADALGWDHNTMIALYQNAPAQRYPPEFDSS